MMALEKRKVNDGLRKSMIEYKYTNGVKNNKKYKNTIQ